MIQPCKKCGQPVETIENDFAKQFGILCEACFKEQTDIEAAEEIAKVEEQELDGKWAAICPKEFAGTVVSHLPCIRASTKALSTELIERGLNLWGVANTGKTRTLFLILRREHYSGRRVAVFTPGSFERQSEHHFKDRGKWSFQLCKVDILAFDDFDKLALNPTIEKLLFGILDYRMSHRKPVCFTHNSTAAELAGNFRTGEPLVRRIRDFTTSIHFQR